jgi:hypothetical protein
VSAGDAGSRGKGVASAIQDQRKMIRQVFNIACGAQASAAAESIPKDLARQRATIATRHDACTQVN